MSGDPSVLDDLYQNRSVQPDAGKVTHKQSTHLMLKKYAHGITKDSVNIGSVPAGKNFPRWCKKNRGEQGEDGHTGWAPYIAQHPQNIFVHFLLRPLGCITLKLKSNRACAVCSSPQAVVDPGSPLRPEFRPALNHGRLTWVRLDQPTTIRRWRRGCT